jgi:hypothetical protein
MPTLKTRILFISHAWQYETHYNTLVNWFNEEHSFSWKNCSVPSGDALTDKTTKGLKEGLTKQVANSQGVIILGGMYAAHSDWIEYEIDEALRMNKTIIGVRPWGQERVPTRVQNAANVMVNWQSASIIQAVRDLI